ncbi:twin-arginine translocase subunit TatC [Flavobacterium lacus]|uniref:Sec-independent protein translocase protein TatC n=1 Tax=Flavobacterium lacus TaxID=1353778 RepID=A0A328WNC0_9FLAO|nr:twin-arginine translocase subunit TatC [Flavobacterium lacus]RAR46626.1 Sec-independent protein translocase TatC [Flavobacterium lacus]
MATSSPKEMSFLDHLEELRWLLIRSTAAILILACAAFFISDFIFEHILFGPKDPNFVTYQFFCRVTQFFGVENADICNVKMPFIIQNTNMGGQVSFLIWTCITVGFIAGFPFILWEIWKFIGPALYETEKKYAKAFIIVSSLLFFLGVLFGYYIITPLSVYFFGSFSASSEIVNEFNLESYTSMIKTSSIACGLLFELPILIYFLTKLGLVTPSFLRKYRKYALIIVLILAAIITPPDIISQIIVAIPIMVLYEISILISLLVVKKELKQSTLK